MTPESQARQLERIAKVRPPGPRFKVGIAQIDRGFSIWIWLCKACLSLRQAAKWELKDKKAAPHSLPCQDCGVMG